MGNGTTDFAAFVPTGVFLDSDEDGCADVAELQDAMGSEATGGRRNPKYPYDFYDTDGSKVIDLFIDIFNVFNAFGDDADSDPPGEPDGYDASLDRSAPLMGEDVWDMHAPDGVIDPVYGHLRGSVPVRARLLVGALTLTATGRGLSLSLSERGRSSGAAPGSASRGAENPQDAMLSYPIHPPRKGYLNLGGHSFGFAQDKPPDPLSYGEP